MVAEVKSVPGNLESRGSTNGSTEQGAKNELEPISKGRKLQRNRPF
jgi:hypothetical protein